MALATLLLPAAALAQVAISESVLHSFVSSEGSYVWAGVVQGADGNLYGTTEVGGGFGVGMVYQLTPYGVLTTLHSFNGMDGSYPLAGLVQGTDGNLYGTTFGYSTDGNVFQIAPSGNFVSLQFFNGTDGMAPYAGLIQGSGNDTNFYGTTTGGGAQASGSIFMIAGSAITTLYSFTGGADGGDPQAALVLGSDGNFYGTTTEGGTAQGVSGHGTVFKITPQGTLTTLYVFNNTGDGTGPAAALVLGHDGNFYGTTSGGNFGGVGTIFRITPQGALTTLYTFSAPTLQGTFWPCSVSGLIQASDGNLYGTSASAGTNNLGMVFKLTLGGALSPAYSFAGGSADGATPCAAPVQGKDGNLYGTTFSGGLNNGGTVYKITLPPPPSVAPVITTTSLPPGQAYSASAATQYVAQLTATGVPPFSWSATGLPPGLSVNSGSGAISGSITSDVPDTYNVTLSLTDSSGYVGPQVQKTLTLMTTCGAPTSVPGVPALMCGIPLPNAQWPAHGDARDLLIYEHTARGVLFHPGQTPPRSTSVVAPANDQAPHCDDFAQAGPFTQFFPGFGAVTSKADKTAGLEAYASCFDWTVVSQTLTSGAQPGPVYGVGLDAWIGALLDMGDTKAANRQITNAYRDPDADAALYSTIQSAHQFGGAIDLSLFSSCTARCTWHQLREWDEEWDKVVSAARWANFPRIQGNTQQLRVGETSFPGPCYPGAVSCVHADLGYGPHAPDVNQ